MKVIHLLYSDSFSGAENVVCQIISMFRDDENVEMMYCSRDGKIREALEARNVKFIPLKRLTVRAVKKVIKLYKPDVIHAHDVLAGVIAALACGKTKLISHMHNNPVASRGPSVISIAYLFAGAKAKRIFWVSNSSYEGYFFHRFFADKSKVLYNIIDVEALYQKMYLDNAAYNYDVVYLGRLEYQKNPQRLLNVFSKVVELNPNIKMAIVGTGNLEEELREMCEKMNLQNNVDFLGFQSNPLKILHDAKVMVMTSRWEGTPMAALEALALGVPIVSTPVDGLKDLISNDVNGYVFDDDGELSKSIVDICNSHELHERLSSNSVSGSKRYNDVGSYREKIKNSYIC